MAKLLSREKQDIILIDDNEERMSTLSSNFDLMTVYDLMEKRPVNCPADRGNLEFMLPDRR